MDFKKWLAEKGKQRLDEEGQLKVKLEGFAKDYEVLSKLFLKKLDDSVFKASYSQISIQAPSSIQKIVSVACQVLTIRFEPIKLQLIPRVLTKDKEQSFYVEISSNRTTPITKSNVIDYVSDGRWTIDSVTPAGDEVIKELGTSDIERILALVLVDEEPQED